MMILTALMAFAPGGWILAGPLFWLLLIVGVAFLVRGQGGRPSWTGGGRETGIDVLERRFAEGELSLEQFYGVRRQLLAAIEWRTTVARNEGVKAELALGFVDLVGFTPLSEHLELSEVGRLLSRFEGVAFDAVTEAGGRVVKLIGGEAMFVCYEATAAVLAGLEILETADERGLPAARAGISVGEVLQQGGDYFGPTVNLANRITASGEPGALLVDRRGMEALASEPEIELAELPPLGLKGIGPRPAWAVQRA